MQSNEESKITLQKMEVADVRKDKATIINPRYDNPKTSPLIFHFEPHPFKSPELRIKDCSLNYTSIEGKDLYIIDDYFLDDEAKELLDFSKNSAFSRYIYADNDSKAKGEEPARAMDNKEKWSFFSNPPQAVKELYKMFSLLASKLEADVTTLPWELHDGSICAPAIATNRIEQLTHLSEDYGKHQDYNTEKGIAFGLPILYSSQNELHDPSFHNGDEGKPWLITLMLYATAEDFKPEYGMGTIFCKNNGDTVVKSDCAHMRLVLFEGDILHSIETSSIPSDKKTWRLSYVFKLALNPRKKSPSLKKAFHDLMKSYR